MLGDLIGRVSAHPAVGGVRFLNVHNYRVCYVRVLLHNSLESLEARHERWSGATAKVEDERSLVLCVIEDPTAPLILQLDNFGVGRSLSEMRCFQKVQFVSVPHCFERLHAEETVGVRYAERRIDGIALLLPHPEEDLLPNANEVKQPEHDCCHQKTRQQDETDYCIFNGFNGIHYH